MNANHTGTTVAELAATIDAGQLTSGDQEGVTAAGLAQAFELMGAVCPHQVVDESTVHAWRLKLDQHRINDRDLLAAVFDIADTPDLWEFSLGSVIYRAKTIRRRRQIAEADERREKALAVTS